MKWFRFHTETLHNPKVQRLSPALFKHWVNLLCLVAAEETQGEVPKVSDVAFHLGVSVKKADDILMDLALACLIDATDAPQLFVHNWNARQYKSDNVTERVRKHRRNVSVTPPDTEAEQIQNRAEPEQTRRNVFVLYDNYMGKPSVTGAMRDVLIQAEEDYPDECITHCFLAAARSSDGRRSWSYVESILKRHQAEGCNERKPVGKHPGPASQTGDAAAIYASFGIHREDLPVRLPIGGREVGGVATLDGDHDP